MNEPKVVLVIVECAWCGRHVKADPKTMQPIEHERSVVESSHVEWETCKKPKGA